MSLTVCWCDEHWNLPTTPTTIGWHSFERDETKGDHDRWQKWRWRCSCGAGGRWQDQSPSVSYHAWRAHVRRVTA